MKRIQYRKLPGRGLKRGAASLVIRCTARLWLGPDHVLCQYTTGYREEYKRFYFRDIQAMAACTTARGRIINWVLLVLAALFSGIGLMTDIRPATITCLISGSVLLLFAVANTIMGPTSRGYLITAVTKEDLPSLARMRTARRVINILKPLIEGAQGAISREGLMDGLAARSSAADPSGRTHVRDMRHGAGLSPPAGRPGGREEKAGNNYTGGLHMALFAVILSNAFLAAVDFTRTSVALTLLVLLSAFAVSVLTIACLVKQHGSAVTQGLKGTAWGALAYMIIGYMTAFVVYIYMFISVGVRTAQTAPWEQLMTFANYPADQDRFLTAIYVLSFLLSLTLGIVGTLAWLHNRRALRRAGNAWDA